MSNKWVSGEYSNRQEFNEVIKQMRTNKLISGASWSYLDNEISQKYTCGNFGSMLPFSRQKVRLDVFYDIASLTKIVGTTTRILQLIGDQRLEWDTQVAEVLVQFPNLTLTIESLLLHISGLPADFEDKSQLTFEKIYSFFEKFEVRPSDSEIIYSDIGYILLGWIIEEIDQSNLAESFQKNIFRPLNMWETTYYPESKQQVISTERQSSGEVLVGVVHDSKARSLSRPIGSAGLFSTLGDLEKFTLAFMRNQLPSGKLLFSSATYQKKFRIMIGQRTIGWEKLVVSSSKEILFHTGFTGTSIGIDVKNQQALILLTNRVHPKRAENDFVAIKKKRIKLILKEKNKMEKPLIILMSHGNMAQETLKSAQMIVGDMTEVRTVSMADTDGLSGTTGKLNQHLADVDKHQSILVIADLKGGTPCNVALMKLQEYPNLRVISGLNLALVIEAMMSSNTDMNGLQKDLIGIGKDAISEIILPDLDEDGEYEE